MMRQKGSKVRKRQSYEMWLELHNFCRNLNLNDSQIELILKEFHKKLDFYMMYRYEIRSHWSDESLELVLKDYEEMEK